MYIYLYLREREFISLMKIQKCSLPKKMCSDFVHFFNSFNRHLVSCSYCAVHNLNLAENHFGKIHETMWRSFLNLSFLPHSPRANPLARPVCPWSETDLHLLPSFHSKALTLSQPPCSLLPYLTAHLPCCSRLVTRASCDFHHACTFSSISWDSPFFPSF